MTLNKFSAGMVAGFAATVVLSLIMLVKSAIGLLPELNVIRMLANFVNGPLASGWILHFIIGTVVWGILFVLYQQMTLRRNFVVKGMLFATAAWLAMMLVVFPLAGAGLFGLVIGPMAPVMTLILHLIFGAILGLTYSMLRPGHPAGA